MQPDSMTEPVVTGSAEEYVAAVRRALGRALCLYDVPGVHPEHPEVEFASSQELALPPVTVQRGPGAEASECCYIERSINSARISLRLKQADETERWLARKWLAFLTQATYAEAFGFLRRVPVAGFDLSFVVTARHCVEFPADRLVDCVCRFITDHAAATTDMKLLVSSRARAVAAAYLSGLRGSEVDAAV